jgi:tetratricopeptide (TPR) repeat protein
MAALDYAFRFASAIDPDPKDKAMAQEAVVLEYGRLGAFDSAIRKAEEIEGWRRGTAYADLAALLVEQGREAEAKPLIEKARNVRTTITDWHGERIDAHIAEVLARLGQTETTQKIANELLADDLQYAGRSLAAVAVGHAARGDFDAAMKGLEEAAGNPDFIVVEGRVNAYVAIGSLGNLTETQRRVALEAGRAAAATMPGWQKAGLLGEVAGGWIAFGDRDAARKCLADAEKTARTLPATMPTKGPLLNRLAATWGRAGENGKASDLLRLAEREAAETLVIDRPAILAETAAGWSALGNDAESRRLLAKAIAEAEGLVNARPRALAVVSICRAIGRQDLPLDDTVKSRLDGLYAGLKAPW